MLALPCWSLGLLRSHRPAPYGLRPSACGLRTSTSTIDLRPTACARTHVLDQNLLTWLSDLCRWRAGTIGAINSHTALGTVVIGIQVV